MKKIYVVVLFLCSLSGLSQCKFHFIKNDEEVVKKFNDEEIVTYEKFQIGISLIHNSTLNKNYVNLVLFSESFIDDELNWKLLLELDNGTILFLDKVSECRNRNFETFYTKAAIYELFDDLETINYIKEHSLKSIRFTLGKDDIKEEVTKNHSVLIQQFDCLK